MDISTEIRNVIETGKANMGFRSARKDAMRGEAKLMIISSNAPKDLKEEIEHICKKANIPIKEVSLDSLELGSVCKRPFPVSFLSIVDPGESKIIKASEE